DHLVNLLGGDPRTRERRANGVGTQHGGGLRRELSGKFHERGACVSGNQCGHQWISSSSTVKSAPVRERISPSSCPGAILRNTNAPSTTSKTARSEMMRST